MIEPYYIAVCQAERIACRSGGLSRFRENVQKNLDRYCGLIDYCCAGNLAGVPGYAIAGPVKLITFGEFAITGVFSPAEPGEKRFNNREIIQHLGIRIPGPETDILASKARQYRVYIAAANIEFVPEWPDFHFNTGFIINPEGKIILKYQKVLTNQPVEISCSSHDILDRYVNSITGKFDPFPVVDTTIGRLAIMVCNDLNSPEIPRIYSLKGAEIVMHLTSGLSASGGGWHPNGLMEAVKRARAYDNCIYLVNSNWGPELGGLYPRARIAGYSAVLDYLGNELVKAEDASEIVIRAKVDIESARKYRDLYYKNPLSQMRSELYAPYYSKTIYPPNTFLSEGAIDSTLDSQQQKLFEMAMANLRRHRDFYSEDDIK